MRKILISLCAVTVLSATSNDPQSILTEVSKLRQMYEECKASQSTVQGAETKGPVDSKNKNKSLNQEISQKNGVIKSLEQTLLSRDRAYREATIQNKNLISQLHTQKVSSQERETLKRAVETAKAELLVAQKALKQPSGVKTVYKDRPVVQEKIVTKTVESNEKINKLQRDLATAQTTIANLQNTALKTVGKDKIIEKVVYRDRPVAYEKIVEKIVYRDRPIAKDKVVEKVVYKDRPVVKEKIVEKIVYKDRPIIREKIVEKVVYKEHPIVKEKIIEKTVYKELKVPKNSPKTVLKAEAIKQEPVKKQVINTKVMDEQKRRQTDKLALEQERKKSAKTASPTTKRGSPSAYRMATIASIYNTPNGTKIDMWESGRSFTSGTSSNGWVKITGYFVDRVWQSADEDYWVKESDVIKR